MSAAVGQFLLAGQLDDHLKVDASYATSPRALPARSHRPIIVMLNKSEAESVQLAAEGCCWGAYGPIAWHRPRRIVVLVEDGSTEDTIIESSQRRARRIDAAPSSSGGCGIGCGCWC